VRYISLFAAGAVVLVANGFALVHAARNRAGTPEGDVVLTDRELNYFKDPDDSGVRLTLQWQGSPYFPVRNINRNDHPEDHPPDWMDASGLRALGFDCHVDPATPAAAEFYSRQPSRTAFVALEYDGPAWHSWLDYYVKTDPTRAEIWRNQSHLIPIDASRDAGELRALHPDRHAVIILPAAIGISIIGRPSRLTGGIREIPTSIHVPRPFGEGFRAAPGKARYRVHLVYGRFLEPWAIDVERGGNPSTF
jgi:hypothetical protein